GGGHGTTPTDRVRDFRCRATEAGPSGRRLPTAGRDCAYSASFGGGAGEGGSGSDPPVPGNAAALGQRQRGEGTRDVVTRDGDDDVLLALVQERHDGGARRSGEVDGGDLLTCQLVHCVEAGFAAAALAVDQE